MDLDVRMKAVMLGACFLIVSQIKILNVPKQIRQYCAMYSKKKY